MTEMSMQMIPSGELAESPLNPRKRFRDVEELAFEVIAGARRNATKVRAKRESAEAT